jgi:lipid-A-disaccharide synthase
MKLVIVAGEASGDLHASEVVRELRLLDPSLEMFGIGGDLLARQGMTLLHHAREMGIVGLVNVLRHLPMFRRIFGELISRVASERPDAVLLVDYPDFNLRVAKRCKELGLQVIYYMAPRPGQTDRAHRRSHDRDFSVRGDLLPRTRRECDVRGTSTRGAAPRD